MLIQFTDFLVAGARKIEEIALIMPCMSDLLGRVGLSIPVAFQLVRPLMRAALQKCKYGCLVLWCGVCVCVWIHMSVWMCVRVMI